MTNPKSITEQAQIEQWLNKISVATDNYEQYHRLLGDIRKYYRSDIRKDKQNIFWSSIETLKPFLYFKQPKPYIERKNKNSDNIQNMACQMIEKALLWNLDKIDFDSIIKYARNDFLLGGIGLVIERYKASLGTIKDDEGNEFEVKLDEYINTEYIDPTNFIADSEKVGIWEDCNWFALKHYMTLTEAINSFGQNFAQELSDNSVQGAKSIEVYEVWDKTSAKVYYLSKSCPQHFLKTIDKKDTSIGGFFPLPKPLLATCTNDSIIPVPDYIQIKPLLDELDGVTSRMQKTMKALKVSGCYDNAFPELANILNKDITLVSISDFDRLKSAGGIKNIVDFMPIDQYVTALTALAARRQDIIDSIYEVTGVSDIMRGNSNSNDTATAIIKKTNFGTLRNQDRQNDMNRFIADLFKIKAEMICENFDREKLLSFLPKDKRYTAEAAAAVALLKSEKLRNMVIGIESDSTFTEAESTKQNLEAINTIHTIIGQAFDIVSKQPALLGLYRQMISSIVAGMSNARQYENVINECFDKIAQELSLPDQPQAQSNIQLMAIEMQKERNAQDFQIKKEQNDIKKTELLMRNQQDSTKNILAATEIQIKAAQNQANTLVNNPPKEENI